jgi:hypothetical protein
MSYTNLDDEPEQMPMPFDLLTAEDYEDEYFNNFEENYQFDNKNEAELLASAGIIINNNPEFKDIPNKSTIKNKKTLRSLPNNQSQMDFTSYMLTQSQSNDEIKKYQDEIKIQQAELQVIENILAKNEWKNEQQYEYFINRKYMIIRKINSLSHKINDLLSGANTVTKQKKSQTKITPRRIRKLSIKQQNKKNADAREAYAAMSPEAKHANSLKRAAVRRTKLKKGGFKNTRKQKLKQCNKSTRYRKY